MSIASITGAARVPLSTADSAPAADTTVRQSSTDPAATPGDAAFQAPPPPRFPWLSRLSEELESASKQKPTFAPAPILGDNIDQSA
jgi:hypothetical protein